MDMASSRCSSRRNFLQCCFTYISGVSPSLLLCRVDVESIPAVDDPCLSCTGPPILSNDLLYAKHLHDRTSMLQNVSTR